MHKPVRVVRRDQLSDNTPQTASSSYLGMLVAQSM